MNNKQQSIRISDGDKMVTLRIGDRVGFKYDVEQSGEIVDVKHDSFTVIAREGGYVHQNCDEYCESCSCTVTLYSGQFWTN